jgi:hypothetical protein
MDRAREGTAVSQSRGISISESRERERGRTSLLPIGDTSDGEKEAEERANERAKEEKETYYRIKRDLIYEEKEAEERANERAKEEKETKERTSFFPKSPGKGAISQQRKKKSSVH